MGSTTMYAAIHLFSIFLELVICVVALRMVFVRKRYYALGLAVTFGIYVFYDLSKQYAWGVSAGFLNWAFFIATVSALLTVLWLNKKAG